jgi:tetratricopeptide (TPR) repeat protein
VFPHRLVFQVLLDGDVIVLASSTPLEPDFARMEACFEKPELRRDFARMHVFQLASLAMFHAIPEADFPRLIGPGPLNTDRHQRLEYLAPKAHFANAFSDLVWRNHDLARSIRTPGTNLLDGYARWRAEQKDPLSREELQGVLRRVQTSLDAGDAFALVEALNHRIDEAPLRTVTTALVARGADPDPSTVRYLEATDRGTDAYNAGQLERAMRWWRHANALEPTRPSAIANLALALDRGGKRGEALKLLQDGLNANRESVLLHQRAAMILEQAGNVPQALSLLDRAAELRPDDSETMLAHGRVLIKAKQIGRAVECYQRLFDIDPSQWQVAAALVQMLASAPDGAARARSVLEQALRIHPGVPELQQLGKALRGP